jgi:hypothetical protein
MARKRPQADTPPVEPPPGELPASDTNGNLPPEAATTTEPPPDPTTRSPSDPPAGSGNGEKKRPVIAFRYPTDRSTTIEAAVWPSLITLQGGEQVQVYSVTVQRSYKDQAGNWQKNGSYRGHDLPVLLHALERAHAWILDQRELNSGF